MKNLSLQILQLAAQHPDKPAIVTPRITLSWKIFGMQVEKFAAHMVSHGVDHGSCVALATRNPVVATSCMLAVGMIGAKWRQVFASKPENAGETSIEATHLFHTFIDFSMQTKAKVVQIDRRWQVFPPVRYREKLQAISNDFDEDAIWYLSQSSGTTGRPKWMEISYENYWQRNEKAYLTHDFNPVITANLFPALSAPWVSYNMRSLWLGGTLVFGPRIDFFHKNNVQKVFGSPHHFSAFLGRQQAPPRQPLPIAHVAGGTISRRLADSILQWFSIIHNFYGSTEVGGVARNLIDSTGGDLNCVGKVLAGNRVRIVDDDLRPLPEGETGRVCIQNDIMLDGYANNEEASTSSFVDGWFYPGDTGYLNEAGELYLTGRYDDVVNVAGAKVNAAEVDRVIQSCPGVKQGICFVDTSEPLPRLMGLLVLDNNDIYSVLPRLQESIARELPRAKRIRGVYSVESIPVNANGKPLRQEAMDCLDGRSPVMIEEKP